jgi:hypothetical protein
MIHYHGTPITPTEAAAIVLSGGHAFVSFAQSQQLGVAIEMCQSFALDNGAFSHWRAGRPVRDWSEFYRWVMIVSRYAGFDFAVMPDVIDGDEALNDALLNEWPLDRHIGAPVWHMHESIDRLVRLANTYYRVCIGSSGEFSTVGNEAWFYRMDTAMHAICGPDGLPPCKLHGLRMLNPRVFTQFPFASADSTNIARNIGIDQAWKGSYTPPTKQARAWIMRERIEHFQAAVRYDRKTPYRILRHRMLP